MQYEIINTGGSPAFEDSHALLTQGQAKASTLVIVGNQAGLAFRQLSQPQRYTLILIELGVECLGTHTGESRGQEGSQILGFSRFRLGEAPSTNLVELVRQPQSVESAILTAKALLEAKGLQVSVCADFAGRILNRLIRPYYNGALTRLDEGLASADDLDMTLKLGLGYPEGPITLLERTGLQHHFKATQALFEAYGQSAYAPARRARVAYERAQFASLSASEGPPKKGQS